MANNESFVIWSRKDCSGHLQSSHEGVDDTDEDCIALPAPMALEGMHAHSGCGCCRSPSLPQAVGPVKADLLIRQAHSLQPTLEDAVHY